MEGFPAVGIQIGGAVSSTSRLDCRGWIPACAGMTVHALGITATRESWRRKVQNVSRALAGCVKGIIAQKIDGFRGRRYTIRLPA